MIMRKTILTILCGAALLGIGYAAGAADTPTPKGYVIAQISVTDPATYKTYADQTAPIVAKYGGRYLVRGGNPVAAEGAAPVPRVAIVEYPSLAAAKAQYYSPEYQAIIPIRQRASTAQLFFAEGMPPAP